MNFTGPSLADIAAVTGRNNDDGMGGANSWFWGIILLGILWGGNGFGFGGNGGGNISTDYVDAAIQRGFDNQTVLNKLNGIENGLCSLGYDQQGQMAAISAAIQATANQNNLAQIQATNALQSQLQDCCCENRAAIAQVRYDMATNTCAIQNTLQTGFRDVIDSNNAGVRAILDKMCAYEIAGYQSKIAEQGAVIAGLKGQISNDAQTAAIVSALSAPAPKPAFLVPNPNVAYYQNAGFYNNGCGCGGFAA